MWRSKKITRPVIKNTWPLSPTLIRDRATDPDPMLFVDPLCREFLRGALSRGNGFRSLALIEGRSPYVSAGGGGTCANRLPPQGRFAVSTRGRRHMG